MTKQIRKFALTHLSLGSTSSFHNMVLQRIREATPEALHVSDLVGPYEEQAKLLSRIVKRSKAYTSTAELRAADAERDRLIGVIMNTVRTNLTNPLERKRRAALHLKPVLSGFKGLDDASVIAGKPTLTCPSYERGVTTAGSYADAIQVDVSGMSAENYTFVAQNGTLTVSAPSGSGIKPEQTPGSGSQSGDGAADPGSKTLASTGDVSLAVTAAMAVIGAACAGVGAIRWRK